MKQVVLVLVALAAGFIAGGLAPRAELREARRMLEVYEENGPAQRGVGRGLAAMFQGRPGSAFNDREQNRDQQDSPDGADPAADAVAGDDLPMDVPQAGVDVESEGAEAGADDAAYPEIKSNDLDDLDAARAVLDARRAQARAALAEQVDLSEDEAVAFDETMAGMNDELESLARSFIDTVNTTDGDPSNLELMRFAADTLDVMVRAGDSAVGLLSDEEQGYVDPEAVDPFSYIDSTLIELFMELER